jgi:hypothetical protein
MISQGRKHEKERERERERESNRETEREREREAFFRVVLAPVCFPFYSL